MTLCYHMTLLSLFLFHSVYRYHIWRHQTSNIYGCAFWIQFSFKHLMNSVGVLVHHTGKHWKVMFNSLHWGITITPIRQFATFAIIHNSLYELFVCKDLLHLPTQSNYTQCNVLWFPVWTMFVCLSLLYVSSWFSVGYFSLTFILTN